MRDMCVSRARTWERACWWWVVLMNDRGFPGSWRRGVVVAAAAAGVGKVRLGQRCGRDGKSGGGGDPLLV